MDSQQRIEMTPFTQFDWYGLAGCTTFEDGAEPLVCYTVPVGAGGPPEGMLVVDAVGIYMDLTYQREDENGETVSEGDTWVLNLDAAALPSPLARRAAMLGIVAALPLPVTEDGLRSLGFGPERLR